MSWIETALYIAIGFGCGVLLLLILSLLAWKTMKYTWKDWLAMGIAVLVIVAVLTGLVWISKGKG